jgi:hypothetical protein
MNKIKDYFKPNKETIEIFKAVASNDKTKSMQAQEALAAVIGPMIEQVLPLYASSAQIFKDFRYDPATNPTLPLDMFEDAGINTVRVWSQATPGGAPSSEVKPVGDYKFDSYRLLSAVSAKKKTARDGQVDMLAKMVERMAQEILRDQELNAWAVLLKSAAEATLANGDAQLIAATTANVLQLDDFNRLKTAITRLHDAWNGGTPAEIGRKGLTDLYLSPEMMEQIRAFAYQPMNTRAYPDNAESTAVALPDAVRAEIYRSGGAPSIYGVVLHELLEFGVAKPYTILYDTYYTNTSPTTFANASEELVLGLDLSVDAFIRPVASEVLDEMDVASTVTTLVDDQWIARDEKFGFYTKVEEGRVVLDKKATYGLKV